MEKQEIINGLCRVHAPLWRYVENLEKFCKDYTGEDVELIKKERLLARNMLKRINDRIEYLIQSWDAKGYIRAYNERNAGLEEVLSREQAGLL